MNNPTPQQNLVRACVQWAFDSIGEGFLVPEEAFWTYSKATGDEDWETLPQRLARLSPTPALNEGGAS